MSVQDGSYNQKTGTLNPKKHIAVGLSGGVDSAVAAWRLQQAGHQVSAIFMQNWEDNNKSNCQAEVDLDSAQAVCQHLNIPLHVINHAKDYWDLVFEKFLDELSRGRTPNPDVWCNQHIKFPFLLEAAEKIGAEQIATGHYARIHTENGNTNLQLHRAEDHNKDQTYFLYLLKKQQLPKIQFPLHDLEKPEIRKIAKKIGLPNHSRPDSTGVCFIGPDRFQSFIKQYLLCEPGKIENLDGKIIGEHGGLISYTIGQRKGINIGGRSDSKEGAWYVAKKDKTRNVLIVCQDKNNPALLSNKLECNDLHWIGAAPEDGSELHAQIRHRQTPQKCKLSISGTGSTAEGKTSAKASGKVIFENPQRAIAGGQSIVFYAGDHCLGGGIIA